MTNLLSLEMNPWTTWHLLRCNETIYFCYREMREILETRTREFFLEAVSVRLYHRVEVSLPSGRSIPV